MITTTITTLVLAAALDDVTVNARMGAAELVPGAAHSFTVEFVLPDGMSAGDAGLTAPFLQLDVPAGMTLTEARSENQAISVPYERLLESSSVDIPFTLDDTLADDATLGLVFTAYLSDGEASRFFRERLELPLQADAQARRGDATNSRWGTDAKLLKIGDKLTGFELPVAEGVEPFDLGDLVGKRPLFLTTYRAHW